MTGTTGAGDPLAAEGWGPLRIVGVALAALAVGSCQKVPIYDVEVGFDLADATWFAEEETLFVFSELHAEQGLNELSVIEVTYTTDDGQVPWTPLSDLEAVHIHTDVDCGITGLCGSGSVHVPLEPRDVRIRLRYHPDGEMALEASTLLNVVEAGPPHTNRSLVVYGVYDETNTYVQWRTRHQFPTLRNHQVASLGLQRELLVEDQGFGTASLSTPGNPYAYGVSCPPSFVATGLVDLQTEERARFNADPLPLGAADASTVCASATVTDATGTFTTGAVARKNPEVRPAFPVLRSPVRDATPLQFFLAPCDRVISADHEAMQRQRLLLGDLPTTCIDDWRQPGFVDDLVVTFRRAVEAARPAGNDMVLVIGLHQDEDGVAEVAEEALDQIVPAERLRSSPRVAGALVLDSEAHGLTIDDLAPVTLWCPASGESFDASARSCAIAPDLPDVELGPFTFGALPILPTRDQYLDFVATYSEAQAGSVDSLTLRTPEFATTSEHVDIGGFGATTFLNGEAISAETDDAFSYCVGEDLQLVVFRTDLMQGPGFVQLLALGCDVLGLPIESCAGLDFGFVPIQWLPDWHQMFGEESYELGVFWEFPFLLRMNYELVQAGSVSAFGLSVPFGLASEEESYYGTDIWTADEFSLEAELTQCLRFCDHPTFDSAGVYHVTDPFRSSYAHACYQPSYPNLDDSGAPLDP